MVWSIMQMNVGVGLGSIGRNVYGGSEKLQREFFGRVGRSY
jgi:hypothetical protein